MNLRTVKFHDCENNSTLEWMFQGSVQDAEKDLRDFVQRIGITHWFATIMSMQGRLVMRP